MLNFIHQQSKYNHNDYSTDNRDNILLQCAHCTLHNYKQTPHTKTVILNFKQNLI